MPASILRGSGRRRCLHFQVLAASAATVAVILGSAILPAAMAADQVSTFLNGTGNWSNPNVWSPSGVPNNGGITYDVAYNGSNGGADILKLDQDITINRYTMSGGILTWKNTGTAFTLTLNDTLNWSGGTIGGANVVATQGGSISANSTCIVGSGTLTNQGLLTYTASFGSTGDFQLPLRLDSNGVIVNSAGATFNIAGDGGISVTSSSAHFDNKGLFEKTAGTGVSVLTTAFNDTGTVSIQSGTLTFGNFNNHSGSVSASAGATVGVGGTSTFTSTSTFGGQGTLQFLGNSVTFGGTLGGGAGPLEIRTNSQAQFVAGANLAALGLTTANGGRAMRLVQQGMLSFNTGQTVSIASLASDNSFTPASNVSIIVNGADDLILNGPATWTGGMFAGASSGAISNLTVNAPLSVSGAGLALDHRNLQNNSTLTWTGGYVQAKNGSVITNSATGTIDIQTDTNIGWGPTFTGFSLPSINNAGLIVKSAGAGETQFNDVRLTNTGTVRVKSGLLTLNYGETNGNFQGYSDTGVNSGIYQIDAGATMAVSAHTMDASSTVQGAGTMEFRGNNNVVAGMYNMTGRTNGVGGVEFQAGAKVTNVGQLLSIIPSGIVSFDTGSPITLHDLVNNGTLLGSDSITVTGSLSGAGTISANLVAPGTISPGNSPGIMTVQGSLTMAATTKVMMELGGNRNDSSQTRYDSIASSSPTTLSGSLALSLVNGYVPAPGDSLSIITDISALSGSFTNVAPGGRLLTTDGSGSFIVDYGAGSPFGSGNVVVTNFQAVPEPMSALAMALLTPLLLRRRTR